MVYIKGQIHPSNPENRRNDVDDLTSAQIKLTNMGYRRDADLSVEAPVIVEHQGMPVGRVTSTWAGPDDSLRMSAHIDDPVAEDLIRSGKMRGLSIGARLMHDASTGVEGALIENLQDEVSICARPRRPGCYITEIDGRRVMTVANASMDSYPPGDFVSREAYDALKHMMDKKSAEVDAARQEVNAARNIMERTRAANEHYVRQNVGDIQNVFKETLQTCNEQEGAFLLPWNSWAENLAKTPAEQLDSEMGLAVFAAKASANVKRGREAEETLEKTKKELQDSHKRVDELEAQLAKSQRATSDMQALAMERSTAMEDLSKRYQKLVGGVNRYDFSLLASREAPKSDAARRAEETIANGGGDKSAAANQQTASGVPATMATGGAGALDSSATEHAGLAATTAVASMGGMGGTGGTADGKAVAQDRFKTTPSQLADFISNIGRGTDRYVPSPFGLGSSSMPSQSEAGSSSAKTDIAAVRAFLSMHA